MPRGKTETPKLDKARLLALLAERPGATKRDLAKLTGLKGSDRIVLKRLLRELEAEGAIAGRAKRGLTKAGALPEMAVLEITGVDDDGEVLARPLNWESDETPPLIHVMPPREGGAPGVSARVLAKLERRGESYEARIVRRLENEAERILGVVRETAHGLRVIPVDRKARGDYALEKRDAVNAKNNELVLCDLVGNRRDSKVRVVERIGSMDSPKTISLIAIHAHGNAGPVHRFLQGTEICGQFLRQHRHHTVGEIGAVAALERFLVQSRTGCDVMGDIGDGDDHHMAARIGGVIVRSGPHRVVMIAGIFGIDGDEGDGAQVGPAAERGPAGLVGFFEGGGRKFLGDVVGMDGDQAD